MEFDANSEITVVVTSCNRFDLLEQTLCSLDEYNTCPVKKVILIEDSGNEQVRNFVPEHWHCQVIVNNPKLGQIKSIDLAYSLVDTAYIFHCEDDWLFYRHGFMEDSIRILNKNSQILQVWLRDFVNDVGLYYKFHTLSHPEKINGMTYFRLGSTNPTWQGFSFNPGLRRLSDYEKVKPYFRDKTNAVTESELSNYYFEQGMFAAILEQSAVRHIGWFRHVEG
ncbi:glycosyltransferase family 2 protein [Enterobacteriaceae bacterium LUAb1]